MRNTFRSLPVDSKARIVIPSRDFMHLSSEKEIRAVRYSSGASSGM